MAEKTNKAQTSETIPSDENEKLATDKPRDELSSNDLDSISGGPPKVLGISSGGGGRPFAARSR